MRRAARTHMAFQVSTEGKKKWELFLEGQDQDEHFGLPHLAFPGLNGDRAGANKAPTPDDRMEGDDGMMREDRLLEPGLDLAQSRFAPKANLPGPNRDGLAGGLNQQAPRKNGVGRKVHGENPMVS